MSGPDIAAAHLFIFLLFFAGLVLWTYLEERRSA